MEQINPESASGEDSLGGEKHIELLGGISTSIGVTFYDLDMDAVAFDEVVSGYTWCCRDTAWLPAADDLVPSEKQ